jgi:hypothetical protein
MADGGIEGPQDELALLAAGKEAEFGHQRGAQRAGRTVALADEPVHQYTLLAPGQRDLAGGLGVETALDERRGLGPDETLTGRRRSHDLRGDVDRGAGDLDGSETPGANGPHHDEPRLGPHTRDDTLAAPHGNIGHGFLHR